MTQKEIFTFCKELGCCDSCCLRYLGIRNHSAYENSKEFCLKFQENATSTQNDDPKTPDQPSSTCNNTSTTDNKSTENVTNEMSTAAQDSKSNDQNSNSPTNNTDTNGTQNDTTNGQTLSSNGTGSPPMKRRRLNICTSCLGLLQEDGWADSNAMVKEVLDKKQYDSDTFGCGLSSPIATILREKVICLKLKEVFSEFDERSVISLKESWKWAYGPQLSKHINIALESGSVSPLLVVLNMEYPDDLQELEILKLLSPGLFQSRSRQKKRFTVEFTRRSVEQALEGATLTALSALGWGGVRSATSGASCVSVVCTRAPLYLGGRYIKLSRELPQTPWLVAGKRMMESSVQEIIFDPLAKIYGMSEAVAEHRLKFMSAGREDVDVRCLGDGRPFAVEITDPRRELKAEELQQICDTVTKGGQVVLKQLVPVTREDLVILKSGEETKSKIYEALCIKLAPPNGTQPTEFLEVTDEDISSLNSYRNTPAGDAARVVVAQKTPVRVLHRRPLLTRTKRVYDLTAAKVTGHPHLIVLRLKTSAGAYVKELVHGELRRTTPSLCTAVGARLDILALDVSQVLLQWPDK